LDKQQQQQQAKQGQRNCGFVALVGQYDVLAVSRVAAAASV
jgi:hypothetical protein